MTWEASAPGRCGIVGNPSDIYGGFVVSCSVPARATCRLTVGSDHALPDDPTLWNAATARFPINGPVRVEWTSDIPRSSGLAGSTALLAATLACLLAARGEPPDLDSSDGLKSFAELVRDVERNEAGVMCGYQDAYMVVHGGLQAMDFAGKHPVHPGRMADLNCLNGQNRTQSTVTQFLLVTTGVERLSGSVHGPMSERWLEGEPAVVGGMARLAEMGRDGAQKIRDGNSKRLAELMTENQTIIASLGGSGDAIDRLIVACLDCGADAAKLAGAGMGGTVVALTEDASRLQRKLMDRGYSNFMRLRIEAGVRFFV